MQGRCSLIVFINLRTSDRLNNKRTEIYKSMFIIYKKGINYNHIHDKNNTVVVILI